MNEDKTGRSCAMFDLQQNVSISDRRYRFKVYKDVFLGCDAVTVLVEKGHAKSREEAVLLGRELGEDGLFEHVSRGHDLKDEALFYRFRGTLGSNSCDKSLDKSSDKSSEQGDDVDTAMAELLLRKLVIQMRFENNMQQKISENTMQEVRRAFQAGVVTSTNTYLLKTYKDCFVGTDAVSFLVEVGLASTREEAVEVGLSLQNTYHSFVHVSGDHEFKDDNVFYRFLSEAERAEAGATNMEPTNKRNSRNGRITFQFVETKEAPAATTTDENNDISLRMSLETLDKIRRAFEAGVDTAKNKYGMKTYERTFVGSDAVSFLVDKGFAPTRPDAVCIGRRIAETFDAFAHVAGDLKLEDKRLFYRFVSTEKRRVSNRVMAQMRRNSGLLHSSQAISVGETANVALAFQSKMKVCNRLYHLKLFKNVFTGEEAVTFLLENGYASSRKLAVDLGRRVANDFALFEHVTNDHDFLDDFMFYKMTDPEARRVYGRKIGFKEFKMVFENDGKGEDKTVSRRAAMSVVKWMDEHSTSYGSKDIAEAFERGVVPKNHKYHGKVYENCFVGSDAVTFLVNSYYAKTRQDAVRIGKKLAEKFGLFRHVSGVHAFKDKYIFYRFVPESERDRPDQQIPKDSINEIATKLKDEVEPTTNVYHLKTYEDSFSGSSVVNALLKLGMADSRIDAVHLVRRLVSELHLLLCVQDEKKAFADRANLYFRYCGEGEISGTKTRRLRKSVSNTQNNFASWLMKKDISDALLVDTTLAGESVTKSYPASGPGKEQKDPDLLKPDGRSKRVKEMQDERKRVEEWERMIEIAKDFHNIISVKDRRLGDNIHPRVFVASDAISSLVNNSYAKTRSDAVQLGRELMERLDLFRCVSGSDGDFRDDCFFYRFTFEYSLPAIKAVMYPDAVLSKISKDFRDGVRVRDNCHPSTDEVVYEQTFKGSEAVDFLVQSGLAKTREKAVQIGRLLLENVKLFEHVSGLHHFEDKPYFYRMRNQNQNGGPRVFNREARSKIWSSQFRTMDPRDEIKRHFEGVGLPAATSGPERPLLLPEESKAQPSVYSVWRQKMLLLPEAVARPSVFTVWRPTSNEAIRKLWLGLGVGKGLDIKGKSAKRGRASGYVPFMQIYENEHKALVPKPPADARVRMFFHNRESESEEMRDKAANALRGVVAEMHQTVTLARKMLQDDNLSDMAREDALETLDWEMSSPSVDLIDDHAPYTHGIELPMRAFWELIYLRQDISRTAGSENDTGRASMPAFQEQNITTLLKERIEGSRSVVLFQDSDNHLCPFNLLMAYEENGQVKPVVSDFDSFLLGSKGIEFDQPLKPEELDVLKWSVSTIDKALENNTRNGGWTNEWIAQLQQTDFHPDMPEFGFGDPVSYTTMGDAAKALINSGSVRHGSECFNYYFPQEMDDYYLVISDHFADGQQWKSMDEAELQTFLEARIDDGYTFPLNAKWVLCDPGWNRLYKKFMSSTDPNVKKSYEVWFPSKSGIREQIAKVLKKHPDGFLRTG